MRKEGNALGKKRFFTVTELPFHRKILERFPFLTHSFPSLLFPINVYHLLLPSHPSLPCYIPLLILVMESKKRCNKEPSLFDHSPQSFPSSSRKPFYPISFFSLLVTISSFLSPLRSWYGSRCEHSPSYNMLLVVCLVLHLRHFQHFSFIDEFRLISNSFVSFHFKFFPRSKTSLPSFWHLITRSTRRENREGNNVCKREKEISWEMKWHMVCHQSSLFCQVSSSFFSIPFVIHFSNGSVLKTQYACGFPSWLGDFNFLREFLKREWNSIVNSVHLVFLLHLVSTCLFSRVEKRRWKLDCKD